MNVIECTFLVINSYNWSIRLITINLPKLLSYNICVSLENEGRCYVLTLASISNSLYFLLSSKRNVSMNELLVFDDKTE